VEKQMTNDISIQKPALARSHSYKAASSDEIERQVPILRWGCQLLTQSSDIFMPRKPTPSNRVPVAEKKVVSPGDE
jgi:hypothetical protein